MRGCGWVCVAVMAMGAAAGARAQGVCDGAGMARAARDVNAVRQELRRGREPGMDGAVSAPVAAGLERMKSGLAAAAEAEFRCAGAAVSAEGVQAALEKALGVGASGGGAEEGAVWGGGLAVQVFSLFDRPRIFEVDYRWEMPCGDDHLVMIFEAPSESGSAGWRETMRWTSPRLRRVDEALGDFLVLTPMTGSAARPEWRYVVAHGEPSCKAVPRMSRFTLQLLQPTADPAKPRVDWEYAHAYLQDNVEPSLQTTEDTLLFRMVHWAVADAPATEKVPAPDVYRFALRKDGSVEAAGGAVGTGNTP